MAILRKEHYTKEVRSDGSIRNKQVEKSKGIHVGTFFNKDDGTYRSYYADSNTGKGLLQIVMAILLAITIYGLLRGSDKNFTFEWFLSVLQEAPSVDLSWIGELNSVLEVEWYIPIDFTFVIPGWYWRISLDWLKGLYEWCLPIIQVLLFICNGLYQFFAYVIAVYQAVVF